MKNILVVDNHRVTLKYLEMLLSKEGYIVRLASDGIEALDIIKDFKPDVFFIDLVMPYIRGEKLIPILRNIDTVKESKIVVLSGIAAEIGSDHVLFGADACIAKAPFNKMGEYILELLEIFKKRTTSDPIIEVIGVEEVYRRAVTTELIAGRRHTDVILNNISDGIIECNRNHRIVYANKTALEFLGGEETDIISAGFESFWNDENSGAIKEYLDGVMKGKDKKTLEVRKSGLYYEVHAHFIVTENDETFIIILQDITLFKKELNAKEKRIKEVYHRVKNNLVLVSSIINLQISDSEEESVNEALYDLKSRIDSIALIHGKIFKSDNPDTLSLKEYVDELFSTMIYSEREIDIPIVYTIQIPEMFLGIDNAISFGLIITELLTNTLKYAFKGEKSGEIFLTGTLTEPESVSFVFHSSGSADPLYFSFSESTQLNLRLVEALTLQLESSIIFKDENGPSYLFTVPIGRKNKQ